MECLIKVRIGTLLYNTLYFFYLCLRVVTESLLLCGIDPPWDLSFGWTQIEAVIVLLFLFPGGPTSNHTRVQMRGGQVCDSDQVRA